MQDDDRIEMMQGYIDYMLKAKKEGCNVLGYYAWSTMDLYSWVNGYEKRYGFVAWTLTMTTSGPPKRAIIGSRI